MPDQIIASEPLREPADRGVASLGIAASIAAVFAALACCVLPLALVALGVGAGLSSSLEFLVPLHWPLSIAAMLAVAAGWALYLRRRKMACAVDSACEVSAPSRTTRTMLWIGTVFVVISTLWPLIEPTAMRLLEPA